MDNHTDHIITVGRGESAYRVHIGTDLLGRAPELMAEAGLRGTPRIVADRIVWKLHGERLAAGFARDGRAIPVLEIEAGEDQKHLGSVTSIYDWLVEQRAERNDPILAFGGGVVGDMVGFVAATYLRGVPLVQIPTTVLAQVDSSVGGKTGVDHPRGKNLIGAFYDARVVISDIGTLTTLPIRERRAGLAEVAKMAAILDANLFLNLERESSALAAGEPGPLTRAVARSVELKGEVVTSDHTESGLRMILNYGHTVGHAIEAATGYQRFLHGEAVSIGMEAAATISQAIGTLSAEAAARQRSLLGALGLPLRCDVAPDALTPALTLDKKNRAGQISWIVLSGIGTAQIRADVPESAVRSAILHVCSSNR
ncbi:MAG: 3-dehydroquinate synthase [Chloroflexota bacterium]